MVVEIAAGLGRETFSSINQPHQANPPARTNNPPPANTMSCRTRPVSLAPTAIAAATRSIAPRIRIRTLRTRARDAPTPTHTPPPPPTSPAAADESARRMRTIESMPFQTYQLALAVIQKDRHEKLALIAAERAKIARVLQFTGLAADSTEVRSMLHYVDRLKIMADVNNPRVKYNFDTGRSKCCLSAGAGVIMGY